MKLTKQTTTRKADKPNSQVANTYHDMKANRTHPLRHMRNVVATVRTMIERQHSSLVEELPRLVRLALNEAESVAWETGVPHLIFPTLAMEKVRNLAEWNASRRTVRQADPVFALAA